jgi:hypothetical protein
MNSKFLHEKGQGNVEALELVSLPPMKSLDHLL